MRIKPDASFKPRPDAICLFCFRENKPATNFFRPPPGTEWPEPLPAGAAIALCDDCATLTNGTPEQRNVDEFIRRLMEYVNEEKALAKRQELARRAKGN